LANSAQKAYTDTMIFKTEGASEAAKHVAATIDHELKQHRKVLWLVSGGSAIDIQVNVMSLLSKSHERYIENLTILPVDERYGPFDHKDSNAAQLGQAGFNPTPALWLDVLSDNLSFEQTVSRYDALAKKLIEKSDYVVATLGLGTDGHTAGILPQSPAIKEDMASVVGYIWRDYKRMTISPTVFMRIDAAYVFAYGDKKQEALQRLFNNSESVSKLPAKLLYDITNSTVYNDYIKSEE